MPKANIKPYSPRRGASIRSSEILEKIDRMVKRLKEQSGDCTGAKILVLNELAVWIKKASPRARAKRGGF